MKFCSLIYAQKVNLEMLIYNNHFNHNYKKETLKSNVYCTFSESHLKVTILYFVVVNI